MSIYASKLPKPADGTVQNNAGGLVYQLGTMDRLDRFLILGADGPTYYVSAQRAFADNYDAILAALKEHGAAAIERIAQISEQGRAPKNDAAIFALAVAAVKSDQGNDLIRQAAYRALPRVCRIPTHLFSWMADVKALGGGWGAGRRRAIARWYTQRAPSQLAYHMVKYRNRSGWTHGDALRVSHPKGHTPGVTPHGDLFSWALGKLPISSTMLAERPWLSQPAAFDALKGADVTPAEAAEFVLRHQLPREAIPARLLKSHEVWNALLLGGRGMPYTAMIRNLNRMTIAGILAPGGLGEQHVVHKLLDGEMLRRARVHPVAILSAMRTYANGRGLKGKLTWAPNQRICEALEQAMYLAFDQVPASPLRKYIGLDVSGSMGASCSSAPHLSCREASAVLAMVAVRSCASTVVRGFARANIYNWGGPTVLADLDTVIHPTAKLDEVTTAVSLMPFGATDCALPMLDALANRIPVDVFEIYTDNETWAGNTSPTEALHQYREGMGIDAKLVVIGMTSTGFTIADPNDSGMLDVVGFDTAVPNLIASFCEEE